MNLKVVQSLSEIEALRECWNTLFEQGGNFSIFEHFEWVRARYAGMDESNILLILIINDANKVVGIFPFAISSLQIKTMKFRTLVHAAGNSADYASFLLGDEINRKVAIKRVVEKITELQDSWDLFYIDNLNEADPVANIFRLYLSQNIYGHSFISSITPSIKLDLTFGEAKKISNIKRRFKKFTKNNDVEVNIDFCPDQALLEQFRFHHRQQFPDTGFNTPGMATIIDHLSTNPDFRKYISASYLHSNGKFLAGHFGFKFKNQAFYYVPVFNKEYGEFGPGQYLLMNMIEKYREMNLDGFDFMRGHERYKEDWYNQVSFNHMVFGAPANASLFRKALVSLWLLRRASPV